VTESEREKYLFDLDETLLLGSVLMSSWSGLLIWESDQAFIRGAHLAALVTAMAGIETQLRFDHSEPGEKTTLCALINLSSIPSDLKAELHELRKFRNKYVHVNDPWDEDLFQIEDHTAMSDSFEPWALRAVTALRRLFYWFQGT